MSTPTTPTTFPGDDIIPDAAMIYDRKRNINSHPNDVFPWLVQLGAARGGWYLPRWMEHIVPRSWRGARSINPSWQGLKPGDRVEDYKMGMGEGEFFTVVSVRAPRSLVYVSHRLGSVFTWTLMCHDRGAGQGTEVHLRFRGRVERGGWQRKVIVWGGDWVDWVFTEPMLRGLQERCEAQSGKSR